jgi:hypothetical protein
MGYVEAEVWVLVDAAGDAAVGSSVEAARDKYEEDVQELSQSDGFRMVKVLLKVPVPDCQVIPLSASAPPLAEASATVQ